MDRQTSNEFQLNSYYAGYRRFCQFPIQDEFIPRQNPPEKIIAKERVASDTIKRYLGIKVISLIFTNT